MRALVSLAVLLVLGAAACASPTAPAPARPAATPPRAAARATPTPDPAASALSVVPLRIDESALPPPEPTPVGFTGGRATPTPFATPEAAWKYVTITFAVENRSDQVRLVGIGGTDPTATNLSGAVLTARDGTRYRPLRSTTSFGQRTATSHALTTYPVLLRLPSGFRVAAESAGTLSVVAPDRGSLTFKIPSGLTDYGTLTIPPLTNLGSKSGDDDVTRQMRPLIAGFHSLDLAGMNAGQQSVSFPTATSPAGLLSVGMPASVPGKVTVTLTAVEASDPDDFEIRNRGWKQVTVNLQYRNDDASQSNGFSVAAWLFGTDGVVYTGDAPTIGDFGRALTPPKAASILLWDGRSAGADQVAPGLAPEPRRAAFLVPRELTGAVLVLSGDVDAMYDLSSIPTPPKR